MKRLQPVDFDLGRAGEELREFEALLGARSELAERTDVLPFFNNRVQLTALVGSLSRPARCDAVAFEFNLFGAFVADAALAHRDNRAFTLIEFEDAAQDSLFARRRKRDTPHWSRRFESGFNQAIDWFWKLADQRQTAVFRDLFGSSEAQFDAVLVIGRDRHHSAADLQRLEWRSQNVVVESKHIQVFTYDRLARDLRIQFDTLRRLTAGR